MASANVFSGFLRPARTVFDYTSDLEAIDTSKLNRRRGEAELAQLQRRNTLDDEERARATASRNAFEGLLRQSGGDQNKLLQALQSSGDPAMFAQGQALAKSMLEEQAKRASVAKDAATVGKTAEETAALGLKRYRDMLPSVTNPQQAAQWVAAQYADPQVGQFAQRMGPIEQVTAAIPTDPQGFEQWRQRTALGMAKFEEIMTQRRGQDMTSTTSRENAAMADARMRAEGAASRAVTMRGQNLADARTRESTAATMSKPFEVTGPDGLPMLVQQDKKGNIVPVQGFGPKSGSAKPLNDTQAKALLFGTRMQESDKVLTALSAGGTELPSLTKRTAEAVPLIGGALGMAANMVATPGQQQVEQAQRDFINAVLRRESGAVIADSEFANARKQYFVEPGDSPAVKKQKARNRQLAIDGLLAEVPEGRRASITPQSAPEGPQTGRVVDFGSLK